MSEIRIPCADLEEALDFFKKRLGFRLEMIYPADEPAVAVISGHDLRIRLERPGIAAERRVGTTERDGDVPGKPVISRADQADWVTGRAGMAYRDLIPGKLGGKLTASLINLTGGGQIGDYVHYHKIAFQMIYCWRGRVRVVYEDCGEPFWLSPGDCVLQPPEIRHRVLESAVDTHVIELTSPAIHETWVDHELTLPTGRVLPDRDFGGQRFVHYKAANSTPVDGEVGGFESHDLGVAAATNDQVHAFELHARGDHSKYRSDRTNDRNTFLFLLTGRLEMAFEHFDTHKITAGDSILIPPHTVYDLSATTGAKILRYDI